jgi:hypothetical protein
VKVRQGRQQQQQAVALRLGNGKHQVKEMQTQMRGCERLHTGLVHQRVPSAQLPLHVVNGNGQMHESHS